MTEYRLHCFAQSGNAYKAALMPALNGADWEPSFVDFFKGATRTPEFRAINPMGEIPSLEDGALLLSQSGVILDHLARRYPDFGPASQAERREIPRWTLWDNHKLTGNIATLRYLINFAPKRGAIPRSSPSSPNGCARASRPSTFISRRATGSRPTARRPPTCPASAISISPTSSRPRWPRIPPSTAGARPSRPCPAGSIPTT